MQLNRRHKALLFITLVITGTSLLAGAQLNEALGLLMLGAAFAWLVGSRTASTAYDRFRNLPGKAWPCLRVLLLMALGGTVLTGLADGWNYNSFLVVAGMCVFWLLISPFRVVPVQHWLSKAVFWLVAVFVFFVAVVAASTATADAPRNARKLGQLSAYALIALPIAFLWLSKGWKLLVVGITAPESTTTAPTADSETQQRSSSGYIALFLGFVLVTLWLGLVAFSASSDSASALESTKSQDTQQTWSFIGVLMLAGWGLYACWQRILRREPNAVPRNLRRHKLVTLLLGGIFTVVISVAVVFGIQNGSDRQLTAEVEQSMSSFQGVAQKIGAIKARDLKTTRDYIDAYGEMEPLLADFDSKLEHFDSILARADQRYNSRGPLNIQRLYSHEREWLTWDHKVFGLLHKDSELTRKQIAAVGQMAEVPPEQQVDFWKDNVKPLLDQEDVLRQDLQSLLKAKPGS